MTEKIYLAAGIALLVSLIAGPFLIPVLRTLKFGQSIREDGPKRHLAKAGTPTIGGLIFLIGIAAGVLIIAEKPYSPGLLTMLGMLLGFGLIGFLDDFLKVLRRQNLGLRAWQKLVGQIFLAVILVGIATLLLNRGTALGIPFTTYTLDLGIFYYPVIVIVIVYFTNTVNLTDGLDGLAAGCTVFSAVGYVVIAYLAARTGFLGDILVSSSDLAVFAAAIVGGCVGFLRFNMHPARVFMGDCGSLALGGGLSALAVLSKSEFVLLIIGAVYVVEGLSVMLQVVSFKTRGKRIFRMAPLHHHFELGGWSEKKVVRFFWTAAALCMVIGIGSFWMMIT
ncbi:phospho-N-acetylmuramoyl-pentapeptide-transferase [Dehalobacter sp. DCM]|uniref:phospho-N-acetylmuramoyl-pentapeptide- transferase n=1 Tax=Dehalobacter sp. DCM TaxID=2907827 RepID=UPI003081248D|nr:phospho-N-acetylmuramoyl-pentapeptide-transferase [Dehalobacter sp. DCM]